MSTFTWHNDNNDMLIKKHEDRIIGESYCCVVDTFSLLKLLLSTTILYYNIFVLLTLQDIK